MTFAQLKTKKDRIAFIKEKLTTNDMWILKGLITIFDNQTADEQRQKTVKMDNGIGFTPADANFMCSIARGLIDRGIREAFELKQQLKVDIILSEKQAYNLRKRIVKYAGQLAKEAEAKVPLAK